MLAVSTNIGSNLADFPTSIEQLSNEFLSEALGTNVRSYTAAPLGEGVGILGLVTRVELDSDSGPKTLIAKFPTHIAENRAVADTYDMYGREYRFYTQVGPHVPLRSPECYYSAFDPGNSDFVLLLEDLQGYRLGDQVEGCTIEEARQVVASLASLHRNTWQPDHITDIKQHDMPYQREGMVGGYQVGWPVVIEQFSEMFDEELIEKGSAMPDTINRLLTAIHDGPLVIAHGDVRLDNVFFSDDDIALVDYQAVCKAAPEHDLAYFVTQSLSDEVRSGEDWPAFYHQHLTSEGIDYPLDTLRERYKLCALYFLCYAVIIAGTLDMSNERGRKLAETLLGNSLRSLKELNAFEFIK